jgi:hypothetical protein
MVPSTVRRMTSCEDGSKTMFATTTRRGYQTFCIPEADSEILRFYSMITADLASAVTELRQRVSCEHDRFALKDTERYEQRKIQQ